MNGITTKHMKYHGRFYFLPNEKALITFFSILLLFLSLFLILVRAYSGLITFFCLLIPFYFFGILPAYKRSEFLSKGNGYKVFDGFIEYELNGDTKKFSYKRKHIKSIERRNSTIDIIIGESMADLFGSAGSEEGIRITLCRLLNGKEVLEYLKSHR